jgi:hypothetical protein
VPWPWYFALPAAIGAWLVIRVGLEGASMSTTVLAYLILFMVLPPHVVLKKIREINSHTRHLSRWRWSAP